VPEAGGTNRRGPSGRHPLAPPRRLPLPANDNPTPPLLRLRQGIALLAVLALAAAVVALRMG